MDSLVIGSNSFSGSYFVDYLLKQGQDVIGTSRSEEKDTAFRPYSWKTHDARFAFHQIDLNHDLEALFELIKTHQIKNIYNFAAQSMVGQSWDFPDDWMRTNVMTFTSLINGLRKFDFLNRFLHVTTPEVYGSTDGFITEDTPYNPSTPYAVSRAGSDMVINCFHQGFGFPFCATRASNVYGPGQQIYRIIPRTIFNILTGTKLNLHGGGVSVRNFIHMEDTSVATFDIMNNGRDGEYYHISGDEIISIRHLVEKICMIMKVNFDDVAIVGEERLGKDAAYMLDSTKIKTELSWSQNIALENGLEETIVWLTDHIDTIKTGQIDYIHKP